jgi:hypothetical protein
VGTFADGVWIGVRSVGEAVWMKNCEYDIDRGSAAIVAGGPTRAAVLQLASPAAAAAATDVTELLVRRTLGATLPASEAAQLRERRRSTASSGWNCRMW